MSARHAVTVLLVTVLAVTAGCSGLSGDGSPTDQPPSEGETAAPDGETPAPEGEASSPTAAPSEKTERTSESLRPADERAWMEADRVNESALFLRHADALAAASGYTVRTNVTQTLENGSVETTRITDRIENDRAFERVRRGDRWDVNQAVITRRYVNESYRAFVTAAENGTEYSRGSGTPRMPLDQRLRQASFADLGYGFAASVNWTADGRTDLGGMPVYRFRGTDLRDETVGSDDPTLSTASMYVDRAGRIRVVDIEYEGQYRVGRETTLRATVAVEIRLSDVNATAVDVPAWVDESDTGGQ